MLIKKWILKNCPSPPSFKVLKKKKKEKTFPFENYRVESDSRLQFTKQTIEIAVDENHWRVKEGGWERRVLNLFSPPLSYRCIAASDGHDCCPGGQSVTACPFVTIFSNLPAAWHFSRRVDTGIFTARPWIPTLSSMIRLGGCRFTKNLLGQQEGKDI